MYAWVSCLYVIVSTKPLLSVKPFNIFQFQQMIVVVCIDFSDKERHRQVGVGRVVISGSLGGVMVSIKVLVFPDHCGSRFNDRRMISGSLGGVMVSIKMLVLSGDCSSMLNAV